MTSHILWIILGLILLVFSADFLVKGASSVAKKLKISPLVIGLTIVAFGTSLPELIVNILAATKGQPGLALGNIIGSNIANILLILGASAAIYPIVVKRSTIWRDVPFALLASGILLILCNDHILDGTTANLLSRSDALVLLVLFGIFLIYVVSLMRNSPPPEDSEDIRTYSGWFDFLFCVGGITGLYLGGDFLVSHASALARNAGVSDAMIGLTIVSIGTSLPELVTSVTAAIRKQNDIAVGNVIGSNIFNVFWILGITGTISPLSFQTAQNADLWVAFGATCLLFLGVFMRPHKITRAYGVIGVLLYIGYMGFVVVRG
jgi:cation:H+ antiporter